MKTIYFVLTNTNTLLSKAIRTYTKAQYNHVSLSFDETLQQMYSFGRRHPNNPFRGGFVQETVNHPLLRRAHCVIYALDVTEAQYDEMRAIVRQFELTSSHYRYNLIGLFGIAFNISIEREGAYFCSEFVATVLERSDSPLFDVAPHFVQPQHFCHLATVRRTYCGTIESYVHRVRGQLPTTHTSTWTTKLKHFANRFIASS